MSKLVPITIACAEYDRTRAIRDGRVKVDGCEVTYLPLEPEELFFRAFRYHDFDVAEVIIQQLSDGRLTKQLPLCRYPGLRISAFPTFGDLH